MTIPASSKDHTGDPRPVNRFGGWVHRRVNALARSLFKRIPASIKLQRSVIDMDASLLALRDAGFRPSAVIDIGAHDGAWSIMAHRRFPEATFHMFEALPGKQDILRDVCARRLTSGSTVHISLLGPEEREDVTFFEMGTGSSVLSEVTGFARTQRALPMRRLDGLLEPLDLQGPLFVKIDTQGFEIEILRGAGEILRKTEAALLETSLLEFNEGAPSINEVIAFMQERDFVPFDICELHRRASDQVLFQCDILFVKTDSALRARKRFFRKEPG